MSSNSRFQMSGEAIASVAGLLACIYLTILAHALNMSNPDVLWYRPLYALGGAGICLNLIWLWSLLKPKSQETADDEDDFSEVA